MAGNWRGAGGAACAADANAYVYSSMCAPWPWLSHCLRSGSLMCSRTLLAAFHRMLCLRVFVSSLLASRLAHARVRTFPLPPLVCMHCSGAFRQLRLLPPQPVARARGARAPWREAVEPSACCGPKRPLHTERATRSAVEPSACCARTPLLQSTTHEHGMQLYIFDTVPAMSAQGSQIVV